MSRVKYLSVTRGRKVHIEQYPNFHKGGMKERYYGKNAMLVRCGDYIYNVPQRIYDMAN